MTWAEFSLRLFAYNRECEREDRNFRTVAFTSLWSFHGDPKKFHKKIDRFWPIGNERKKSAVSEEQKVSFIEQYKEYLTESNGKT